MTVAIGILCQDGVVLATDSMITNSMGNIGTTETKGKKIYSQPDNHLSAFAGDQALAQRFRAVVEHGVIPHRANSTIPLDYSTTTTIAVRNHFTATGLVSPFNLNMITAFCHSDTHHCVLFDANLQPRLLDEDHYWVVCGTGKQYADPFLTFLMSVFCERQPNTREAIFLATWAVCHAIETNTGGVNGPVQMAYLQRNTDDTYQVNTISKQGIEDKLQAIEDAKRVLINWRNVISGETAVEDDDPPQASTTNGETVVEEDKPPQM